MFLVDNIIQRTNGNHLQMSALQLPLEIRQRVCLALGAMLLVVDIIGRALCLDLHRHFSAHLSLCLSHACCVMETASGRRITRRKKGSETARIHFNPTPKTGFFLGGATITSEQLFEGKYMLCKRKGEFEGKISILSIYNYSLLLILC